MPDTSWAERAYSSGALDPSLGQAFSFPSLLQLRLRIEVPLWRDLATARHPAADLPAEEDSASDATGSAERSPRLALPVPVGLAEPPEADTEEAPEDEDMAAEPNYAFAKGYGRFGIGYTRLATALGNFEQENIQAESTAVAQWLTSGLRVAMSRTGWNLLSPRYMLTKVPSALLSNYFCHGYPFTPKMEDRPYNQYGPLLNSEGRWDQLYAWLTGIPSLEVSLQATSSRLETTWATVRKPPTQVIKLAVLSLLQKREAPCEIADRAFCAAPLLRHVSGNGHPTCRNCGLAELPATANCQAPSLGHKSCRRDLPGCYVLREVAAPGCVQCSRRVFAECCSLGRVGVSHETEDRNVLAPGAQPGKYAFESCLTLTTSPLTWPHQQTSSAA